MNRRARSLRAAVGLFVIGVVGGAGACREPTQVTLDITYSDTCSSLRSVGIIAASDATTAQQRAQEKSYTTVTTTCSALAGGGSRVGTISLTPGEKLRAAVTIVAGIDRPAESCTPTDGYSGCIVARRSFAFIEHAGPVFPIRLDVDCKSVPCDAVTTCKKGKCVDVAAECNDDACVDKVPDDAGAPDGRTADSATDGEADAAVEDAPSTDTGADVITSGYCPPGPGAPMICPPYVDPGQVCTVNCIMAANGTSTCAPATGQFNALCTASRQCGPSMTCCWGGANNQANCVMGSCGGGILCRADCDCTMLPGTTCRFNKPGGPPFVKFCF